MLIRTHCKSVHFLNNFLTTDVTHRRVGFAEHKEKSGITIPGSVELLLQTYDVIETAPTAPTWDFMWNATVEEGREKRLLRLPFVHNDDQMSFITDGVDEMTFMAESALKVGDPMPLPLSTDIDRLADGFGDSKRTL